MPAQALLIWKLRPVSQPRRLVYLTSWKGIRFGDCFSFHHPKVSNRSCTGGSQHPWETAWAETHYETHFWSHCITSNMSKEGLAEEFPLPRKTANKQTSPKQIVNDLLFNP